MAQAYHRTAYGRRRRHPRTLFLSQVFHRQEGSLFADQEQEAVYTTGLDAAQLMLKYFPAIYQQYIGPCLVTPPTILATVELFLTLAHRHLVRLVEFDFDLYGEGDPIKGFEETCRTTRPEEAVMELENGGRNALDYPVPECYGLSNNLSFFGADDALALGIHHLFQNTPYAVEHRAGHELEMTYDPEQENLLTVAIEHYCAGAMAQAIWDVPPINGVGVDFFQPFLEEMQTQAPKRYKELAVVLVYVLSRTGNTYADYTNEEVLEYWNGQYGMEFDDPDMLAAILLDQQEAERYAQTYRAYANTVANNPRALKALLEHIAKVAQEVLVDMHRRPARRARKNKKKEGAHAQA